MNVVVVGTGYVGLVAGACLAETGNDVASCGIDERNIARLNAGDIPIYEPGLEPLVERNLQEGRLSFTTDVPAAMKTISAVITAVGTPPGEDGSLILSPMPAPSPLRRLSQAVRPGDRYAHEDRYTGKIVEVKEGHALSLQKHERRMETMYLQSGRLVYHLNGSDTP